MSKDTKRLTVFNSLIIPTIQYAIQNGIPAELINKVLGTELSDMDFPTFHLTPKQYILLIRLIYKETGVRHLGLKVGENLKPGNLGILGYVLMNCLNFGDVINKLLKYHLIIGNVVNIQIDPQDPNQMECRLTISNRHLLAVHTDIIEGYITGFLTLFRELTGDRLLINEIRLNWPPPADCSEYERVFQTDVKYDQPYAGVVFDTRCREQPIVTSNPKLLPMLEEYAKQCYHDLRSNNRYSDEVTKILSHNLSDMPGLDTVAYELGLGGKNLQLKLKAENTSFNQLKDTIRFEFTKNYLKSKTYSAERICMLLGLSEPSVFYRAFKRWTGLSLKAYRSQYQSALPSNRR
jgi:AraC-like DNA-binding protein